MKVDRKGRAVIRKEVLVKAGVQPPCTMLASAREKGVIELKAVGPQLARATRIGARKLKGWKEEAHRGERLLFEMSRHASS